MRFLPMAALAHRFGSESFTAAESAGAVRAGFGAEVVALVVKHCQHVNRATVQEKPDAEGEAAELEATDVCETNGVA